jgi:Domain of unknown function (DUF4390)
MTDFSTPCCERPLRGPFDGLRRFLWALQTGWRTLRLGRLRMRITQALQAIALVISIAWLANAHAADGEIEVSSLRAERAADGLYLNLNLRFELPPAVEEALLKGIPMTFVSEADIYRDRWYWYDKQVATASRSVRLAYQPLTRRWRISVVSGTVSSPANGIALTQHVDSLNDALGVVRRVTRWKIAEASDVEPDARHNIDYRFQLDISQLPRPLQIGVSGQSEWDIRVQRNLRPE